MSVELTTPGELCALLGARLKHQRLAQAISQTELAGMAGLSVGAVQNLERGKTSLVTFVRVVQALGLAETLADLFVLPKQSIAAMTRAENAAQRQRAPRRSPR